ncbi:hypothetical protein BGX34_003917 [Mortierella sp. NVP85]|nr:hypothetical protein BGX34_003917 [Mortierella sp. NVP85]
MGNNISQEGYDKEVFQSYRIPPKAYKKKSSSTKSEGDASTPSSPSSVVEFNTLSSFKEVSVLSNNSTSSSLNLSIVNAALAAEPSSPEPYMYSRGPVSAPVPIVFHGTASMGTLGSRTNISVVSDSFDPSHSLGSGLGKATYVDGKIVEMGFHGNGGGSDGGLSMSPNTPPVYLHSNYTVQDFLSYQQQQQQQFLEQQQLEYNQMMLLRQKQQQQLLLQQQQYPSEFDLLSQQQQITGITLQTKSHRPARHPDRMSTQSGTQQRQQLQARAYSFSSSPTGRQNSVWSASSSSSTQPNSHMSLSPPGSMGSPYQTMLTVASATTPTSSTSALSTLGGDHSPGSQRLSGNASTVAATSTSTLASSPRTNKLGVSLDDLAAKILPPKRMLGGREYYPDKTLPYLLPCDEQEGERLLLEHYVIRYAFGSNIIPPIDMTRAGKILDCGCGPGTWVMEMSTDHPDIEFYGFDVSPMYPSAIHPRNAHFSIGNLLDPEIPFDSDTFVLVHQRNMLLGLTQDAWPGVVQDLFRCVLPGGQGWLQLSEVDPIWARPGPVSRSFLKMLNETAQTRNVDVLMPQRLDQVLKDVGCENVKMMVVEIPIGPWGGKIGILWRDVLKAEMEALKPIVLQAEMEIAIAKGQDIAVCGAEMKTSEEWDDMMGQVWAEMDQYRTYSRVYLAYGQKP